MPNYFYIRTLLLIAFSASIIHPGYSGKAEEERKQKEEVKRKADVDKTLDKEYLWDKIVKIIVEHLSLDLSEIVPEASLEDDLGADELDMVELLMTFEEEFDFEISDEDAVLIQTVKDAFDYVCAH